ncbi:MAG: FeoB small GTPase domain-containing protein, partial [Methylotenera sp.]
MKRIALLGMPNTGKSTLFNRISGASARVGNWPGITVDLMSAKILIGGHIAELIDLPGIYDLHGFSEDEQVVRHFLANNAIDLVIVLLNSSQIDRQLSLVLQIKRLNLPAVLALNMADEARQSGVTIDSDSLAKELQMPVLQISAKYGEGIPKALQAATQIINQNQPASNPQSISQLLQEDNQIEQEMEALIQHHVQIPATLSNNNTDKIDKILLHKWFGLPIFFAAMFVLFQFIFTAGKPLQDGLAWLLGLVRTGLLEPLFTSSPAWFSGLMLDGVYNGVATVAAFVPIIVLFFLVMS